MAIPDNKDEIKAPEKVSTTVEQTVHFNQEKDRNLEKKESSPDDAVVLAQLRKEIELMELDPEKAKDVEIEKEKIEYLGEKEKVEHLLRMAREKGLVFAIQIAKKMNDPYILDILHDTLVQEGFYKDAIKH